MASAWRTFPSGSLIAALVLGALVLGAQARGLINTCPEVTGRAGDLVVQTPILQYTVTNFDPSWFDTDHPEKAPTLFTLFINPEFKKYAKALRLRVQVLADTSLGRSHDQNDVLIAFDRTSNPLDSMDIGRVIPSQQVFDLSWEAGGVSFTKSSLYDVILQKRAAPEMNLTFRFNLTCEDDVFIQAQSEPIKLGDIGHLRYVKMIQALYPGTSVSSAVPVPIYTVTPIFKVASELFNKIEFDYPPDQPKIEIFLYEVPAGTNPKDALDGMEYAKFGLFNESPSAYPAGLPLLLPGMTYVWRARAVLRGPTTDYLYSDPLYFKVDERLEGGSSVPAPQVGDIRTLAEQIKYGDDYGKRVMAALKIILGDNFEIFDQSRNGKIPAKGQIRLNGHPYSLEELERLARDFHQARLSVTRMRFQ
ncbi:MAG: hypothetical protein JF616_09255 [Fibrobacteres bacterium]|nr:hypothetical protein [Fibrobacterota bacterium]